MKVYKYQERHAGGRWSWKYIIVPDWVGMKDEGTIEGYLDDSDLLSTWSEHYRGVDCKRVRKPPADILDIEISNFKSQIKENKETLRQLKEMKEKFYSKTNKRKVSTGDNAK